MTSIAAKCVMRRYPTNTLLLRQEDLAKSVYFVKAGKVKVLRKVDFRVPDQTWQHGNIQWLGMDPTEEDYSLSLVESKLLELDELHNGDFFADDCVLLRKPIRNSMITAMPSEILTLDMHDFITLDKDVHESCLLLQKSYPEDADLRRAFIEMNRWTKFKNDMVHTVRSESINKKQNYDKQLRRPAHMPVKMPIKSAKN